jgi:hypothetical protein
MDRVTPLGILADETMREGKKHCHAKFDVIWQNKHMTRDNAYQTLANKMDIPKGECHFGWFDLETLRRAYRKVMEMRRELNIEKTSKYFSEE